MDWQPGWCDWALRELMHQPLLVISERLTKLAQPSAMTSAPPPLIEMRRPFQRLPVVARFSM